MTKKELINALAPWPDDAQVEIGVAADLDSEEPALEDKVWLEIAMVEDISLDPRNDNMLCLIFGGRITMG